MSKPKIEIRHLILVAALVSTVYAEHRLAVWIGMNEWLAYVIPGVADLYLIKATKDRRDVMYSVLVVIALCSTSYAVTMPWDPVKTTISILVADLAPIVLWRLHITHDQKMELLWGKEAADAVHEQRDNGYTYEFLPSALLAAQTLAVDVPEPEMDVVADEVTDGPKSTVVNLTDEQREQTIYSYFTLGKSAAQAAEASGVSVATCYRRYRAYREPVDA